jgi:hypothetical protein
MRPKGAPFKSLTTLHSMMLPPIFNPSPWDSALFGVGAYEITACSREALELTAHVPGHYTVRVDPLASKQLLHEYGFYYCDTLIEPYCAVGRFSVFEHVAVRVSRDVDLDPLLVICHGAFSHGRFHRDFNLPRAQADRRYENWLTQLHSAGKVYGLLYRDELAGFIAVDEDGIIFNVSPVRTHVCAVHPLTEQYMEERTAGQPDSKWFDAMIEEFVTWSKER